MTLLNRSMLHPYQVNAIEYAKDRKKCGLFLDMGLGKTLTSLTVASDMLDDFLVTKVLIIGHLKVCNTVWKQEAERWEHLKHLKVVICTGSSPSIRMDKFKQKADIYIINRENIKWMTENGLMRGFDMCIIDESTSFKSHGSNRLKALKKVTDSFNSLLLLSGTPAPNGHMDLWSQLYLIDGGKRLGKNITTFRGRFCTQAHYCKHVYLLKPEAMGEIQELISDVCISMEAKDHIKLPERENITYEIDFTPEINGMYKELSKTFVYELDSGKDIFASNSAVLGNKLLQFCNGAVYYEDDKYHIIHDEKINSLRQIRDDYPDDNILVAYNFKSDLERLQSEFKESVTISRTGKEIDRWNKGEIKMLLGHPVSAGYGLNIQFGGSIVVWFGLNWSLDVYEQFNARLYRQGQKNKVRIIHIIAKGKLDTYVMTALKKKSEIQNKLIKQLRYK
ncbi:hypothetical protein BJAS_P3483 [Bathymodiolus japonicus methanotrophic gill symbiont]|uniref:DEAD/DEAH box helicase n=1 Tax=Bathymodiolus japonicus methanotrophic gill symbiont TaxID=113269 RepID=UPI001B41C6A3|nr:DEAD/DEAH box helicase [Bathymodiolus japonicus methanotrophic gill symbiont]GFO72946.1 hypothetical protein BJAS_P3483 [Bathymodiolus japonicus methanotrophic gill symbiont]